MNSHTTNAYPITKEVHETDPTYQNYMNGFFGFSLNGLK